MGTKFNIILSLVYLGCLPAWAVETAPLPGADVLELLVLAQERAWVLVRALVLAEALGSGRQSPLTSLLWLLPLTNKFH